MLKFQLAVATLSVALVTVAGASHAAAPPSDHPAYLHALQDIKHAQYDIQTRGGSSAMAPHELAAVRDCEAAQYVIYKVAPKEGKNIHNVPPSDSTPSDKAGKLHDAVIYLQKAKSDLSEPESDAAFADLHRRLLILVSAAADEANAAIVDFEKHK